MFRVLFFVACLSLVASCSSMPRTPTSFDVSTLDAPSAVPTDFSPEKYMFVKELNTKGKMVFFYQDQEGYTHFYNGKEDRIINKEVMDKYKKIGAVPMWMSYGFDGKYIYFSQPVRWGPKKLVFIKLEQDGRVVYTKELSSLEQVIRPASMAFDGKGGMLLTWIDETSPFINAGYMLVKGDSFAEKEEIISYQDKTVLFVQPVHTDKGFAVVYVRTSVTGDRQGEIRLRFLSDGSEKVLYSGEVFDIDLMEKKGVFLVRPYQVIPSIKLLTFNSSFEKLKEYTVENPKELGQAFSLFNNMDLVEGEPFILGAGSPPRSVEVEGYSLPQKPNFYYSYAGRGFERVAGGMPFLFTNTYPSFDSSEKHTVVAYVDRRFASPTIMAAVFGGDGKLIKTDVVIEKPGIHAGTPSVVHLGVDVFRVFYPVEDKGKKVWMYRAKDVTADRIDSLYRLPSMQDKQKLLTETVEKYVECRKKNDFGCVYDLLDPAYRSDKSKPIHEGMMKELNVTITDFRFDNCKILDNSILAACDGYIKAKLPAQIKGGSLGNVIPEVERAVEQEIRGDLWVFLDEKWHFVVNMPMLGYALQW